MVPQQRAGIICQRHHWLLLELLGAMLACILTPDQETETVGIRMEPQALAAATIVQPPHYLLMVSFNAPRVTCIGLSNDWTSNV